MRQTKSLRRVTHKGLGVRKITKQGTLKIAYRVPGTGEILLLREGRGILTKDLPVAGTLANMKLKLLLFKDGKEKLVGRANYYPTERDVFLGYIWTEPKYRKRDVAASLLSYISAAHGKPISAQPTRDAEGFYKELGFVESARRQLAVELQVKRKFFIKGKK